jgi:hypothetical protein
MNSLRGEYYLLDLLFIRVEDIFVMRAKFQKRLEILLPARLLVLCK